MIRTACSVLVVLCCSSQAMADPRMDCIQRKDQDRAIRGCSELIDAKRDSESQLASTHTFRGQALLEKGDYNRAIADFSVSIKMKPNQVDAYFWRGRAKRALTLTKPAIDDFTEAIANSKKGSEYQIDLSELYCALGVAYEETGDHALANEVYTAALFGFDDDCE